MRGEIVPLLHHHPTFHCRAQRARLEPTRPVPVQPWRPCIDATEGVGLMSAGCASSVGGALGSAVLSAYLNAL